MSKRYVTYGFRSGTLEEAATMVEGALGISLSERDSSYYAGSYYNYTLATGRSLHLYRNYDSIGEMFVHERYRDYSIILEVSDLKNMEEIERKLTEGRADPVLLDSKELPDDEPDDSEPERAN